MYKEYYNELCNRIHFFMEHLPSLEYLSLKECIHLQTYVSQCIMDLTEREYPGTSESLTQAAICLSWIDMAIQGHLFDKTRNLLLGRRLFQILLETICKLRATDAKVNFSVELFLESEGYYGHGKHPHRNPYISIVENE